MPRGDEASVQEILDSIKKVIARDNRAGAMEARRRRETTSRPTAPSAARSEAAYDDGSEEVFDLADAEMVDDPAAHADDEPREAAHDDARDRVSGETRKHARDEGPGTGPDRVSDDDEPLVSETARNAMRDNLATLALLSEPGQPPQIVRSGETSLEGMVRDMLRPMLAEWLDTNLPPLVEDLVRQEIARIVKKQG